MNLEKFVADSIVDIENGLKKASTEIGSDLSVEVSKDMSSRGIHFDVAVTVSESSQTAKEGETKASIQVLSLGGSGSKSSNNASEMVSRIQFNVIGNIGG